jgi:hypothetical protein
MIKFRAKRIDNNELVEGYFIILIEGIRRNACIISEIETTSLLDDRQIKWYIDDKTLEQFSIKDNAWIPVNI